MRRTACLAPRREPTNTPTRALAGGITRVRTPGISRQPRSYFEDFLALHAVDWMRLGLWDVVAEDVRSGGRLTTKSVPADTLRDVQGNDLDPPLALRALTAAERESRQSASAVDSALADLVQPRIAAHIAVCRQALDVIEGELDVLIETLSLDPSATTRSGALWLLMGRSVGQQRAVLLLAEGGMAVEGRPLDRTVKETTNLIKAIAADGPKAEKLAHQWLADDRAYVKAQAGRRGMALPLSHPEAEARAFAHLGVDTLDAADKEVYDDLSRAAHGRRSSLLESFYTPTRHMARGTRYALLDQAISVEWASTTTAGVVIAAAAGLLPFHGNDWVVARILGLSEAIRAINVDQPLGTEAIARQAGISRYPYWPPPVPSSR